MRTAPGVSDAFTALYDEHFGYVWKSLRRGGVPERDLEDAAHDVFVVVYRRLAEFDPSRPAKPWLAGIAYRVAADRRKKKSSREVLEADAEIQDAAPGAHERLESEESRRLVLEALEDLDEDRRMVFVLHEIDDVSAPDIASSLGIPLNTVYSRLRIARERFAKAVLRMTARRRGEVA